MHLVWSHFSSVAHCFLSASIRISIPSVVVPCAKYVRGSPVFVLWYSTRRMVWRVSSLTGCQRAIHGFSKNGDGMMTAHGTFAKDGRRPMLRGALVGPTCLALLVLAGCTGSIAHLHPFDGMRPVHCARSDAAEALELRYLGTGGVLMRWNGHAIMTAPFYSNPGLLQVGLGLPISPNTERMIRTCRRSMTSRPSWSATRTTTI